MFNDFQGITLGCATLADGSCFCDYPSSLIAQGQCALAGDDVLQVNVFSPPLYSLSVIAHRATLLQALGIRGISFKLYAVILLLITLIYRVMLYIVLVLKRR